MHDNRAPLSVLRRVPLTGTSAGLLAAVLTWPAICAGDFLDPVPDWVYWFFGPGVVATAAIAGFTVRTRRQRQWREQGGEVVAGGCGRCAALEESVDEAHGKIDAIFDYMRRGCADAGIEVSEGRPDLRLLRGGRAG